MTEKKDMGENNDKPLDPEKRFKYVGFEVQPGKIKDLFGSEVEKERWVERVREKRKGGSRIREKSSFDEPRVAGYERIVLTITSLLLVISLFLPWFSGHREYEVEARVVEETAVVDTTIADSTAVDSLTDSTAMVAAEEMIPPEGTVSEELSPSSEEEITVAAEASNTPETGGTAEEADVPVLEKDEHGFASLTAVKKRIEIRKEYQGISALGSLGLIGRVFSSGFILKISGFLYLIYMLLCIGLAFYTLYILFGLKGDADTVALKLKQILRYSWIPVGIWFFCFIISFFGASYSFNAADAGLVQLGNSYGIATYLGILGYGFYISLACFIMNAVKAIEI